MGARQVLPAFTLATPLSGHVASRFGTDRGFAHRGGYSICPLSRGELTAGLSSYWVRSLTDGRALPYLSPRATLPSLRSGSSPGWRTPHPPKRLRPAGRPHYGDAECHARSSAKGPWFLTTATAPFMPAGFGSAARPGSAGHLSRIALDFAPLLETPTMEEGPARIGGLRSGCEPQGPLRG